MSDEPHGGDRVEVDGRTGKVNGYKIHAAAGNEGGSWHRIRFDDTGEDEWVPTYKTFTIIEFGAHDYWQPRADRSEKRGICRRCGVRKRLHGTTSTARGMEGKWATPNREA